jgi:hypothetical protein
MSAVRTSARGEGLPPTRAAQALGRRSPRSATIVNVKGVPGESQAQRLAAKGIDPQQQGVAGIAFELEGGRGELAHPSRPSGWPTVAAGALSGAASRRSGRDASALLRVDADIALMKLSSPAPVGTFVSEPDCFQEPGPPPSITREGQLRLIKADGLVNGGG